VPQPNQVKVALEGPHGEIETLWATVVAPNQYELDNLPWCAYGVSAGDVIEARPDAAGQLRMTRIVRKSGNRTIRVILAVTSGGQPTFESQQMLSGILERGCSYEGRNKLLFAVNIPAPVNLAGIAQYLTDSGFRWEYADPTFNDLFPGEQGESDPADA
jgi:uncharacterized protein DUF4265